MPAVIAHRNAALDVLRAIAIILVMFHHNLYLENTAVHSSLMNLVRKAMVVVGYGGWIGVDLFFVLSGFLISGLLYNEYKKTQTINAGRFLIRRGFKLYPSFIFFIAFAFIAEKIIGLHNAGFRLPAMSYLYEVLFIRNYTGGRFVHTWSLDVEEHFYILLSFFFLVLIRLKKLNFKTILCTYLFLCCFTIGNRIWIYYLTHASGTFYNYTHTRLDGLFAGVVLGYIYSFEPQRFQILLNHKTAWLIICLLLLLPNFAGNKDHTYFTIVTLTTNPICFGILMIILLYSNFKLFNNKVLAYIGQYSYNIYLWHYLVMQWVWYYFFHPPTLQSLSYPASASAWLFSFGLSVALSLTCGIIFTKLIEVPFLKLRNRLYPSKTKLILQPQELNHNG